MLKPVAATIAPVAACVTHGLQTPQHTAGALFPHRWMSGANL
jgi:hypothetical protein